MIRRKFLRPRIVVRWGAVREWRVIARPARRKGPRGAERTRPAREWLYNRALRRTGTIAGAEPSVGTDRPGYPDC